MLPVVLIEFSRSTGLLVRGAERPGIDDIFESMRPISRDFERSDRTYLEISDALITAIHYNSQEVFTLQFLTHADYDKDTWKNTL